VKSTPTKHVFMLLVLGGTLATAAPLGTAFTYQGRLAVSGNPAGGLYDLRFILYDAASGGSAVAGPLTNSAVEVTNGLFTVALDFGPGVFDSGALWLEMAVRPNSGGSFTTLAPRQALTPSPYAIYAPSAGVAATAGSANSVAAANVTGTLAPAQLPPGLLTNHQAGVTLGGTFSGNGAGLTDLNAGSLIGTVPNARLSADVALLSGNASFQGAVTAAGFVGNGAGLSNADLALANTHGAISLSFTVEFALTNSLPASYTPTSLAAADVNRDGWRDLIWANSYDNSLSVLTNNGNGGFSLASTVPTGDGPLWVTAADLNGDGWPDLVSANHTGRALSVLTNDGTGGFGLAATLAESNAPLCVVAADVNGDGRLDLVSANPKPNPRLPGPNALVVFTNDGNGGFVLAAQVEATNALRFVATADVDGDGWVDLISPDSSASALLIFTNNRSGGFGLASAPSVGLGAATVVAIDANGDGWPDLISANSGDNTLSVLTNDTHGGFVLAATPAVGSSPSGLAAGEVNGDGWPDLISANAADATLTVLTNNRLGEFGVAATLPAGLGQAYPKALLAADFNGDGWSELAISLNNSNAVWVYANLGGVRAGFVGSFAGSGAGLTSLDASQLTSGRLPSAQLFGAYANVLAFNNSSNSFGGNFNGNGTDLTNVNAASLGGLSTAGFWQTSGNAGTVAGVNFLGTADNRPLELKVNGQRALRLEPNAGGQPNVIGGSQLNAIGTNTHDSVIAGGYVNVIGTNANFSAVGGGYDNTVGASSSYAAIAGGEYNSLGTNVTAGFIGGGYNNTLAAGAFGSVVGGGYYNLVDVGAFQGVIGGGNFNSIQAGVSGATIAGGMSNTNWGNYATVPGGLLNYAGGAYSLAAGRRAKANHPGSFVWADSTDADFPSTTANQLAVRAGGGVRLVTGGAGLSLDGQPVLPGSSVSNAFVLKGGDTMTGTLNLPANGLAVGSSQLALSGGNVGIGTASPGAALDVIGNLRASTYYNFNGNPPAPTTTASAIFEQENVGPTVSGLSFDVRTGNPPYWSFGSRLRIDSSGNVGIGTTSPTTTLDVNGTVTVSGNLALPASSSSAGVLSIGGTPFLHAFGNANTFVGLGAGNFSYYGHGENTAIGYNALHAEVDGFYNTAIGTRALEADETGFANTALGAEALKSNVTGVENTAVGEAALSSNSAGFWNAAIGVDALGRNTDGNCNTALGWSALYYATNGGGNTALGAETLSLLRTGCYNIALGYQAGYRISTGSSNICIGNLGLSTDDNIIRIGTDQTKAFIAGIYNVTSGGSPVYVNQFGQLGTVTSSARFKQDIRDMAGASEVLYALHPVTFHYKPDIDPAAIAQFGLIAEEVEKVEPDLVLRDAEGRPYTVRYEAINAMLLNEFLKQHRVVEAQASEIAALKVKASVVDVLEKRLSALEQIITRRERGGQ
jgi:hypothetical protein